MIRDGKLLLTLYEKVSTFGVRHFKTEYEKFALVTCKADVIATSVCFNKVCFQREMFCFLTSRLPHHLLEMYTPQL